MWIKKSVNEFKDSKSCYCDITNNFKSKHSELVVKGFVFITLEYIVDAFCSEDFFQNIFFEPYAKRFLSVIRLYICSYILGTSWIW